MNVKTARKCWLATWENILSWLNLFQAYRFLTVLGSQPLFVVDQGKLQGLVTWREVIINNPSGSSIHTSGQILIYDVLQQLWGSSFVTSSCREVGWRWWFAFMLEHKNDSFFSSHFYFSAPDEEDDGGSCQRGLRQGFKPSTPSISILITRTKHSLTPLYISNISAWTKLLLAGSLLWSGLIRRCN